VAVAVFLYGGAVMSRGGYNDGDEDFPKVVSERHAALAELAEVVQ
jgi:hypothetical protein